jgi:hypothetical protein
MAQIGNKVMTEYEDDDGDRRIRNRDSKQTGKFVHNEEALMELEERLRAALTRNGEL